MFPSDNNNNNALELLKKPSFMIHQNPPSIFSNFPSPFFDEHESILPPPFDQPLDIIAKPTENNNSKTSETSAKREKPDDDDPPPPPPSKRRNVGKRGVGKKDRHSKIRTAQGIRDRRMRLSLQIARKFFDLQDMLGYDKASSTIEWLFSKSSKAINELMMTKDGIDINFSGESFLSDQCDGGGGGGVEVSSTTKKKPATKRKTARKPNNNVRETREKARARARWRTREKMMIKLGFETNNNNKLINSTTGYWGANDINLCSPQKLGFCNDQQDVGTIEKLLGNSSLSSSTSNFSPINSDHNNYNNNNQCCIDPSINFMGFLGNWDLLMMSNDQLSSAGNINVNPTSVYSPNFTLFHHQ